MYPTMPSPSDLWCRHTKPKKECTSFTSLFLPCLADVSFLLAPLQSSPCSGCQIGKMALSPLCFSLRYPKSTLFWAIMSFIWVQIPAPTVDSHFYSSAVTEINYWVKFIMPGFLSLWGNTFGELIQDLEKTTSPFLPPAYLNCSNRWHMDFFPQKVQIYFHQSWLFYQLDKYTCSPAVGSTNLCITNSS